MLEMQTSCYMVAPDLVVAAALACCASFSYKVEEATAGSIPALLWRGRVSWELCARKAGLRGGGSASDPA